MNHGKRRKVGQAEAAPSRDAVRNEPGALVSHQCSTSFKVPGLLVTDYVFKVPLDHSGEVKGDITLFVRELVAPTHARRDLPHLLYLQGGPGFESPRPTEGSGWIKSATAHFRVVLMDQRGTGGSSPITTANLEKVGSPEAQARYLGFFRADSIVADAEAVRKALLPPGSADGRWSVLGQSFGGFCALTYLSNAPGGLLEVMLTGGIPPAIADPCPALRAYRALYRRVLVQNQKYYARFPDDEARVRSAVAHLAAQPGGGLQLRDGSLLSPRSFQLLGLSGLGSGGGFERLHYLLESFFDCDGQVNPSFLKAYEGWMHWDTNPLYALLHEPIYCSGEGAVCAWAAQRVREEPEFARAFDAEASAREGTRVNFTGEMVFPWMFEELAPLRPYARAAHLLAERADWPRLYRPDVLAINTVPVAAATYLEDMYVDYDLAQETVREVAGVRQWVTNEYRHSAIRDDGGRVLDRLLSMVRDGLLLE